MPVPVPAPVPLSLSLFLTYVHTDTHTHKHLHPHTHGYTLIYTLYLPFGWVKYLTLSLSFFTRKIKIPLTFQEINKVQASTGGSDEVIPSALRRPQPGFTGKVCKEKSQCGCPWGARWWLEEAEGGLLRFAHLGAGYLGKLWQPIELYTYYVGFAGYVLLLSKVSKMIGQEKFHYTYLISDFHYAHIINLRILTWFKKSLS